MFLQSFFLSISGDTSFEVKTLKIVRNLGLFALGGGTYVGLELLWRRRSHSSMFCAGGICFLTLGKLRQLKLPYPLQVLTGAGMITAVELVTGLLVNRDYRVWDYRSLPGNYRGQICPLFTAIWIPVAALGMELYGLAEGTME